MAEFTPPNCDNPPNLVFGFDSGTNVNPNTGQYVPPPFCKGTWDLSTSECADSESNYHAGLMAEALNIAAGPVNVFPMLGVHSQGSTLDLVGAGFPLSSGTPSQYNALNAFNIDDDAWRSIQTGAAVLTGPAYIGYDFGTKKAWEVIGPAQERYFPAEPVRVKISTIKIRQSADPLMRATQARIDASDDGITWTRVDVVSLPNSAALVTVGVNSTAIYNKWRIVPTFFAGVSSNNPWEVLEIHLMESTQLSLENIEDFILLENRDRSYCQTSTMLKCTYDLLDVQSELAKFGINLPQTYIFTLSFADMVRILGRPVIVGDIVELPGEVQYDHRLRPVRKWLEVTDCGWSTEGYTQNWRPQLFRFYAQPILPAVEHRDILGLPGAVNKAQTDEDFLFRGPLLDDLADQATEAIRQDSLDAVPLTGSDGANVQSGKSTSYQQIYDGTDIYVEDAIPPNGAPYTFGSALPDISDIVDGHYHRQTWTDSGLPVNLRPPDRLLLWNNNRWTVVETNTRIKPSSYPRTINSLLNSPDRRDIDKPI